MVTMENEMPALERTTNKLNSIKLNLNNSRLFHLFCSFSQIAAK